MPRCDSDTGEGPRSGVDRCEGIRQGSLSTGGEMVSGAALDRSPAGQTSVLSVAKITKEGNVSGKARPRPGGGKCQYSVVKGVRRDQ